MTSEQEFDVEPTVSDIDPAPSTAEPTSRRGSRVVLLILALLIVTGSAGAVWQYVREYRPDAATNGRTAETVVAAAKEGAVAVLSYAPDTLQRDFDAAKSHLGGDFLAYYNEFTEQVVTPAARDKKVTTTAKVTRAAVDQLEPDKAKVLAFISQTTTSTDKPEPVLTTSSVLVTLDRHDNTWLISGFDPI